MKRVEPKIFIIGETRIIQTGLTGMLQHLGVPGWTSDATTEGEELVEIAGRLCYKSFEPGLNANVTKVREGNVPYIGNVLKQKHGSVLEHAVTTVAFVDVSRILTHEYVRHRAGKAYSQESMRFVRLDDIPMWVPDLSSAFEELHQYNAAEGARSTREMFGGQLQAWLEEKMVEVTLAAEKAINTFSPFLDKPGVPFHIKKKVTSALRRMAPSGHATNIVGTGNHRAWRNLIAQRTAHGAEVEIRLVFAEVARAFRNRYPSIYQDMREGDLEDGVPAFVFENEKV